MDEIPNGELTVADAPSPDADYQEESIPFALSFDGYMHWGAFEQCAEIGNTGKQEWRAHQIVPDSLTELRTCLFFEQRRWKHFDKFPDTATMRYLQDLLKAIRRKVVRGVID